MSKAMTRRTGRTQVKKVTQLGWGFEDTQRISGDRVERQVGVQRK